jgi:hypothetical protein
VYEARLVGTPEGVEGLFDGDLPGVVPTRVLLGIPSIVEGEADINGGVAVPPFNPAPAIIEDNPLGAPQELLRPAEVENPCAPP